MSLKRFVQYGLAAAAIVLCVIYLPAALGLLGMVWNTAAALLLGCAIAYVWNLLLRRFEGWYFPRSRRPLVEKSRRPVCLVLSLAALGLIVMLVINIVLPELTASVLLIGREIPGVVEQVRSWLIEHADELPSLQSWLAGLNLDWPTVMKDAFNLLMTGAGGIFNSAVTVATSVVGVAVRWLIAFIFALYLLFAKERLARQGLRVMEALLSPQMRQRVLYVLNTANECFSSFIVGQCMEGVILGVLCAAGMTALQLPYAVMTGTIIGVTALVPVAGAYIGGAVGAFVILTVDPMKALIFLIFLVILQQLEGNLIYPRVVGSSIGLPGIWVLATVTIGGGLLGIRGMLLGVPLAATCYRLFADYVRAKTPDFGRPPRQEEPVGGQPPEEESHPAESPEP